jgi:predicted nucleic acid-binding protein
MTAGYVIDASVGFSWVHPDQATPETDAILTDLEAGTPIVVPALWFIEMANGLLVLQRRKRLTAAERREALQTLAGLHLTVDDAGSQDAFGQTSALADKYGLSVYDATYLEVAIRQLVLASRDPALRAAARKCGVAAR